MDETVGPGLPAGGNDLAYELLNFDDDLSALGDSCAFYCDATVTIMRDSETLDPATVEGVSRFALDLKQRLNSLRDRLERIRAEHADY